MYKIEFSKEAYKFLQKQPARQQARIIEAVMKLPNSGDIKPMQGHDNLYRLRVGAYRVIYTIDGNRLIIRVLTIGNRGDVYK